MAPDTKFVIFDKSPYVTAARRLRLDKFFLKFYFLFKIIKIVRKIERNNKLNYFSRSWNLFLHEKEFFVVETITKSNIKQIQ